MVASSVDGGNRFLRLCLEVGNDCGVPPTDVQIVTSDGQSIPAHSGILALASPVLERTIDRARRVSRSGRTIHILGAPHDAVFAFVQFLYSSRGSMSSRDAADAMQQHGMALLALSHAYRVSWLKRRCEASVAKWVSAAKAVDALKLAQLCDAPVLRQRCMRVVAKDFSAVQESEGWRFAQKHDPAMELEILQFLHDAEQRKKRWRRERTDQEMYRQLSEAMDSLQHICTEGCTDVGPHDRRRPASNPCTSFSTCAGLQLLLRHFVACPRKLKCTQCKRMWQLFRLHSSLCHHHPAGSCKVPLCKQFKKKMEEEKGDKTWQLLVKKVATARVMSSLDKREVPQMVHTSWADPEDISVVPCQKENSAPTIGDVNDPFWSLKNGEKVVWDAAEDTIYQCKSASPQEDRGGPSNRRVLRQYIE
ncbi:BTB/POZ and TAZ domain-containing protein 2 isoform X1 [Canna indica]|uniref:BTB/POZ and TAZ domain-containing protein 2 isoform X1 n=1 Tax=Canna indica TaxID=4628 RepID=A0AAQ3QJ67_9LILI|nr:BTB/POZ and TAZ domain-containing protein 2 isoform X1 [Canna indica]